MKEEPLQRREQIIRSALEAFTEKGIFKTTMSDIRHRSGASTGSVYHHFGSKQHIAFEIYLHGIDSFYQVALDVFDENQDGERSIKKIIERSLRWHDDHRQLGYYLFRAADTGFLHEHDEAIRSRQVRFLKRFGEWVAPRMHSGEIRPIPPRMQVPLIVGPTREFLRNWMPRCEPQHLREALDLLPQATWDAIKGQRAS